MAEGHGFKGLGTIEGITTGGVLHQQQQRCLQVETPSVYVNV